MTCDPGPQPSIADGMAHAHAAGVESERLRLREWCDTEDRRYPPTDLEAPVQAYLDGYRTALARMRDQLAG